MDFRKTVQQLSKTDPALKQASEQVQKHLQLTVDLILEKALAYQDKPKQHPLHADPTAPEAALAQLLDSCGLLRRRKIRKAFEDRVGKREKDRNAYFGALAGVAPAKSTAIVDQVRPLLKAAITKSPAAQAQALIKKLNAAFPKPAAAAQGVGPTSLVLELAGIKCVEKTLEAFEISREKTKSS